MIQMLAGFQISQALYVAAKLGVADQLVDGPHIEGLASGVPLRSPIATQHHDGVPLGDKPLRADFEAVDVVRDSWRTPPRRPQMVRRRDDRGRRDSPPLRSTRCRCPSPPGLSARPRLRTPRTNSSRTRRCWSPLSLILPQPWGAIRPIAKDIVVKCCYWRASPRCGGERPRSPATERTKSCERMELSPTTCQTHRDQIKQTIRPHRGKVTAS